MKISALPTATTPLSGAELFPLVQSGNTRRVTLNDLLRSIGNGTAAAPALAPGGDPNTGIYFPAADTIGFVEGGVEVWRMSSSGHFLAATDNSFDIGASGASRPRDLFIGRNFTASGAVQFTGTSYPYIEAGGIYVDGGFSAYIRGSSRGGPGAAINFYTHPTSAGALRWQISADGHLLTGTDNSFDIGASGANRPRNVFVAGNITAGGNINISAGNVLHLAGAGGNAYLQESSGTLFLGAGGAGRVQVNASGNVGVGVTPSAWDTTVFRTLQVGTGAGSASLSGRTDSANNAAFGVNLYYGSGAYRYIATGTASYYNQQNGIHSWHTAASGTAGNAITFTQAMTLFASGSLTIGGTNDCARLRVEGSTNLTTALQLFRTGNTCGAIWQENGAMRFGVNGSDGFNERWAINNSGHFLAGVDNSFDIGASGATRPRTVYAATSVEGGYIRAGAASAGAASTTTIGNGTATTVGAAGAASALPANPLGYIIAHVGTTQVKIPYYNN